MAALGISCNESSVARLAMQWNALDGIGRRKVRACETWRRTVERECKHLNETWFDLKQVAQARVRWRVGVVDALCFYIFIFLNSYI